MTELYYFPKKKNSPKWTGTMKAGYSRRKRVLYVSRYTHNRIEQERTV